MASDAGTAFVGTEAADARRDALLVRPGMPERVAEVRAQMAAAGAVDAAGGDVDAWADLVGPFYDTATLAAVLGVSPSAVRSRRARGSLLAMRTGSGAWVYPAWEFNGRRLLPGLAKVLRVLSVGNVSGWTVAAWLRTPDSELGGRTLLEVLQAGGNEELVLRVASNAATGWAR